MKHDRASCSVSFLSGLVAISLLVLIPSARADDWPQWRGPNRDGISAETGLLASWPANGPPLVWKTHGLGVGYSAFAVVGDRLFTQGQQGSQEFVIAFDTNTGKQLWKTPGGHAFHEQRGPGPRGTPTIDGTRLYAVAADGTLIMNSGAALGTMAAGRMLAPFVRQKLRSFLAKLNREDLIFLCKLIGAGKLTSVIDRTYPLSQTPEAIGYVEAGHARGKVVITVRS